MHTNTRSTEAEQRLFSTTPTQHIKTWVLSNSLVTGRRMYLITQRLLSRNGFKKCLDFMSFHAIKCYCGSIFVCNLQNLLGFYPVRVNNINHKQFTKQFCNLGNVEDALTNFHIFDTASLCKMWKQLCISGVASPKIGGPKCLILGEQHYFVSKNASQSTKWLYFLKIWGGRWPLCPSLATPMLWICENEATIDSPRLCTKIRIYLSPQLNTTVGWLI